MSRPRVPKDLHRYASADIAARQLENLAQEIGRRGGLVKWSVTLRFWEDDPKGEVQCMGFTARNLGRGEKA